MESDPPNAMSSTVWAVFAGLVNRYSIAFQVPANSTGSSPVASPQPIRTGVVSASRDNVVRVIGTSVSHGSWWWPAGGLGTQPRRGTSGPKDEDFPRHCL